MSPSNQTLIIKMTIAISRSRWSIAMTINVFSNMDVFVSNVIPFCALFVIEAVVVVELWGVACVFGDFDVPVSWSTV